jgi:hypothetical protein
MVLYLKRPSDDVMKEQFWLKVFISIVALGVILARLVWPNLRLDAITLGLIIVAILPWLSTIIESAKFGGDGRSNLERSNWPAER